MRFWFRKGSSFVEPRLPESFSKNLSPVFSPFDQECSAETVFHSGTVPGFPSSLSIEITTDKPLANAKRVKAYHSNLVVQASDSLPEADGHFVVIRLDQPTPASERLALSTADCLAVVMTGVLDGVLLSALVHAGWRGYCDGIHFNAFAAMNSHPLIAGRLTRQEIHKSVSCFISPAIFGANYECGSDVSDAISVHRRQRLDPLASFRGLSKIYGDCADISGDDVEKKSDKIHPDLQLMMCCDLIALGVSTENIHVLRENTYGHSILPSFRHASKCGKGAIEKARRMFTHIDISEQSRKLK